MRMYAFQSAFASPLALWLIRPFDSHPIGKLSADSESANSNTDSLTEDVNRMVINTNIKDQINNVETQTTTEVVDEIIDKIEEKSMKTSTELHARPRIPWLLHRCFRGVVTREWWSLLIWATFETFVLLHLRRAGASGWIIVGYGATVGVTAVGHLLGVVLDAIPCCCCCCCRCCWLRRVVSSGPQAPRGIEWAMAASITVPLVLFGLHAVMHGPPQGMNDGCDGTEHVDWFAWGWVVGDAQKYEDESRSYIFQSWFVEYRFALFFWMAVNIWIYSWHVIICSFIGCKIVSWLWLTSSLARFGASAMSLKKTR